MARDEEKRQRQAKAHSVLVRLALPPYTIHFKSPNYIHPTTLDLLDKKVCKETLKSTARDAQARFSIGTDAFFWADLVPLLKAAIPSLERRSFEHWDPSSVDYESTKGELIASNYPGLWRDLERLNDLVSISRNCLTVGAEAQDLASDYGVDVEIFRLINCCVRVTARGYEGTPGTAEEEKWQWVVNAYKKLLITGLQFLNNLVARNEGRKLGLWLSLFDNTSDAGAAEGGVVQEQTRIPEPVAPAKPSPPITSSDVLLAYGQNGPNQRISPLEYEAAQTVFPNEPFKNMPANAAAAKQRGEPNAYVYFTHQIKDTLIRDFKDMRQRSPTLAEIHRNIARYWHEQAQHRTRMWGDWQELFDEAVAKYRAEEEEYRVYLDDPERWMAEERRALEAEAAASVPVAPPKKVRRDVGTDAKAVEEKIRVLEEQMAEKWKGESGGVEATEGLPNPLDPRSADEKFDMRMLFTAEAGTKILESGKAELMKRLEGYAQHPHPEEKQGRSSGSRSLPSGPPAERPQHPNAANTTRRRASSYAVDEAAFASESLDEEEDESEEEEASEEEEEEEEEEEDYPGSTEDGRGLLTDVPLILGPSEIEVLPMLIMSGLVLPPSSPHTADDTATLRTHLLLSQTPGRNLLRELLIFVAAWDLREEELYFKFMVRILEAILEAGLMPYAYHAFRDRSQSKDIISPAQAVIMKLLTCIFRGRNAGRLQEEGASTLVTRQGYHNVAMEAHRRSNPEQYSSPTEKIEHSPVDLHILNFIFTEFRQHIIPQTCALIFLQGQIHRGRASPEDFPLNLWDMERMYEGVYQYLEFFAVLTEDHHAAAGVESSWKSILGEWEMASELVTLLRELEGGIPKVGGPPPPPAPQQQQERKVLQQQQQLQQRSLSADAAIGGASASVGGVHSASQPQPVAVERPFDLDGEHGPTLPPLPLHPPGHAQTPHHQVFEPETPLAYPESVPHHDQDEPSDFEWRNLKKLTVLVLSSLIWKNRKVQDQVREYGGLEALVGCCRHDEHNPYIREHAIMCLRFAVEGCEENAQVIRGMAREKGGRQARLLLEDAGGRAEDVPKEVLDTHGYETFMDGKGQVGLRRKDGGAAAAAAVNVVPAQHDPVYAVPPSSSSAAAQALSSALSSASASLPSLTATASAPAASVSKPRLSATKMTAEKAAELMQNALKDLPLGNELVTDRQKAEALARLDRAFESTEKALGKGAGSGGNGKKG
ncbi:hypothetical protein LTR37_011899 [Vermiconidia calcicola]|uniref:Uncharacterized protein n=1 Tax=Vermiconidia calcicola TaxID=1690605 RepID=A0ACC3N267_9PEZI|nr:hypothetical protein LTR37_011899 [Vermiconidia calcicola]